MTELELATPTLPKLSLSKNGNGASPKTFEEGKDVIEFAKSQGLKVVDVKFVDLPGTWQHFTVPLGELEEDTFVSGLGFDGSSIRGFQAIHESDMLLIPDPKTAVVDPACAIPTLSLVCNVVDPVKRQPYTRDPRYVAQKAEKYLKSTGIATTSFFGPEAEFFIFDSIRYDQNQYSGYYFIDSDEGIWNSGRENNGTKNLGNRTRNKEGYFPVAPADTLQDIRSEIVLRMMEAGIAVETHHHEVATAGQCEIDMRFDSLTNMADKLLLYKYIVKNVARAHGKTATFMPKPLYGDNGSGMHCHQSLWKDNEPLFFDANGYAQLSQTALWYIGGLLKHAPALLALLAPTTNSYRRLVPGFEAPVNLVYSQRNRSAAVRIPMYSVSPKAKRIEFRPPDASCNPYLAFAAMLLAGLDGIQNKIDPGQPMDMDLYESEEGKHVKQVPGSLSETLKALEDDHQFLLKGDVFTQDLIDTYIAMKRAKDVDPVRLRPHPYEFFLYYDA
ncbi:MAG TPA: type I glutamate--ammonia ligase [Anaerolineae bacterium]|nr:type I glutamate--ammonia ligase [Anaerolineae bacterium]